MSFPSFSVPPPAFPASSMPPLPSHLLVTDSRTWDWISFAETMRAQYARNYEMMVDGRWLHIMGEGERERERERDVVLC